MEDKFSEVIRNTTSVGDDLYSPLTDDEQRLSYIHNEFMKSYELGNYREEAIEIFKRRPDLIEIETVLSDYLGLLTPPA